MNEDIKNKLDYCINGYMMLIQYDSYKEKLINELLDHIDDLKHDNNDDLLDLFLSQIRDNLTNSYSQEKSILLNHIDIDHKTRRVRLDV